MRKVIFISITILFFVSTVFAHSGRTDRCGGHNDRKHGGYHIHNLAKYCNCHPDAPECKKDNNDKKENIKEKKDSKKQ